MQKTYITGIVIAGLVGLGLLFWFTSFGERTVEKNSLSQAESDSLSKAYFAGGCFWCVESDFEKLDGVVEAISGYGGGSLENPTYRNHSGHREVVQVLYDKSQISYPELVSYFFQHHDPTDAGGAFCDRGFAYSPAVYYQNKSEKAVIDALVRKIDAARVLPGPVVTAVEPQTTFWPAEEYHQDYYLKNPIQYGTYRKGCGRDAKIAQLWQQLTNQEIFMHEDIDTTKDKSGVMPDMPKDMPEDDAAVPQNAAWADFEKPSDEELRNTLTELQYQVTQKNGTERSHTEGNYDKNYEAGIYVDIVSGEPLFSSTDKYDSGTGWPSFTKPISNEFVVTKTDYLLIIPRTEVRSKYADSHLGHVFRDGPRELNGEPSTGMRWCMNGAAMRFVPQAEMESEGYGDFLYLFN